jgi:hypothetical protein
MNAERERMAARELAIDTAIKEASELQCRAFCELMIEWGLGYFGDTGRFDLTPEGLRPLRKVATTIRSSGP